MKPDIKAVLWDFARSVSRTTLNKNIASAAAHERNNVLAAKATNDIIAIIKNHERASRS